PGRRRVGGVRRARVREGAGSPVRREPTPTRGPVPTLGWARRAGRRGGARRGQGDVVQQLAGRRRRVHARGRPRTPRTGGGDREAQKTLAGGRPRFARGVLGGGVRVRHGERVRGDRGVRTRGGRGRGPGDGRRVH